MENLTRRQILLAGLTTGVAASLTTDHVRRREARRREEALQAIAEAQLDADSLMEATVQRELAALEEVRSIQASVDRVAPPIPYDREMSKQLILGNKLTTQQYLRGKLDPHYDGSIQILPAFGETFRQYNQVASFRGHEEEAVEDVEIQRPANVPLYEVQAQLQDHLDQTEANMEDAIQEVVQLRRKVPVYYGFVLESEERSLVVFRGTQRRVEWLNNISAIHEDFIDPKVHSPLGRVHVGFHGKYKELVDPLPLEVMGRLNPTKPCYVSGHSLGGAIATLAALDAALNLPELRPQLRLYTYASPRVGDVAFANAFQQQVPNSYRIVNLADVVPLVPPTQLDGPYVHVGQKWAFLSQNDDVLPNHQIKTYRNAIDQEAENEVIDTYVNLKII